MKLVYGAFFLAVSTVASGQSTPKAEHVGGYIPNSQLLEWCNSSDTAEFRGCYMYIQGVINLSGNPALSGKSGPINIPLDTAPLDPVKVVTAYIQHLNPTLLSSPASDSVYSALVAKYPNLGGTPS